MEKDGYDGLRSVRELPGRPLIVTAARTRDQILRGWRRACQTALVGFAIFASTVAALAWLAVRALRSAQFAAAYQRRGEARLKRQRSLLQSILENIDEGLSVFDGRGRLIARNQRFCELLDLPADMPFQATLADILMHQTIRGDFGETEAPIEVAGRLARFYDQVPVVKERVTPTGRTLQIRRRAMPEGAVLSIYSDITEIRASERKIVQARSQAEIANRSKSEFLANMSHELRTPLNAIIGFSEIISNELFGTIANEKYLEYMKDIHASSLHLLSIINDVLDMSKIEAGKFELSKERIVIRRVVADVVRMMRERAGSRGIALVQRLGNGDIAIWADERAMRQILLNLLSNAIKFSAEGGSIIVRLDAGNDGSVVLEVEDHGIGMDEAEQKRALQPFGQAKTATTRDYGGTGLGLPITKGLVEAHGGALTVISQAGKGTTVRVVLPTEPLSSEAEDQRLAWPYPVQIE